MLKQHQLKAPPDLASHYLQQRQLEQNTPFQTQRLALLLGAGQGASAQAGETQRRKFASSTLPFPLL